MVLLSIQDIVLRLGLASLVGALVGVQRETNHRPAGLRTHMLVALGAACTMILGEYMAAHYGNDPTRLGAQVISGIGFLGAGTILKEGVSIKGLTTAASLWAVACVGLIAGAGFYEATVAASVIILFILVFVERIQKRVRKGKGTGLWVQIDCRDVSQVLLISNRLVQQYNATLSNVEMEEAKDNMFSLQYKVLFGVARREIGFTQFIAELSTCQYIINFSTEEF